MSGEADDRTGPADAAKADASESAAAEPPKDEPAEAAPAEPAAAKSVPGAATPKQDPREWIAAGVVMLVIGCVLFLVTQWLRG